MKKNLFLIATVALVLSISFSGCKKDDDDDVKVKKNHLMYENVEYAMSHGFLDYWGPDGSSYNFDITLFSSGISYDTVAEMVTGTGHYLWLQLWSSSASDLLPGTYTYDTTASSLINTFDEGMFAVNLNTATLQSDLELEISGGSVTVAKTGSTYELTIDLTATNGKKITGYYKGTLRYFDESKKKSKTKE